MIHGPLPLRWSTIILCSGCRGELQKRLVANKESLAKIYQQAFWIKTEKNRKWEKELAGAFGTGEIAKRHKKYRYSGFLLKNLQKNRQEGGFFAFAKQHITQQ
ncbi:MAG: hypothetical protein ACRC7P_09800 [Enterovibrio sp.]